MKFVRLSRETLDQGYAVFNDYLRSALCWKADQEGYLAGKRRRGGVCAVPGALIACLDSGIVDVAAVTCGVARATRCRRSTVESFLRDVVGICLLYTSPSP